MVSRCNLCGVVKMAKGREILKVDKITGEAVARYTGIAHAQHENPYSFTNYYGLLEHAKYKRLHYSRHVFRYADEYDPRESFTGQRVNVPLRVSFDGMVLDLSGTLAVNCFYANGIQDVAKVLRVDRTNVSYAIKRGFAIRGSHIEKLAFMGDFDRNAVRYGYILVLENGKLRKHWLKGGEK